MAFIKFTLIAIFSFFFSLMGFAQLKPIYFIGESITKDSTLATSYGIYGKLTGEGLYALKIFDLDNNLKTTGTYKDENLKIAHGDFVYYADVALFNQVNGTSFILKGKTRFITGKGSFVEGRQTGRWISFFPNGKIMNVTTYSSGIRHGFYGTFDKKGKNLVSGAYHTGQKDGEWLYDNGKVKEIFIKGVKQQKSKNKKN